MIDINTFLEEEKNILSQLSMATIHDMKVIDLKTKKEFEDPDSFFYGILFDNEDIIHTKDIKIQVYTQNGEELYRVIDETIFPNGSKTQYTDKETLMIPLFNKILETWCHYHKIDVEKTKALLELNHIFLYGYCGTTVEDFLTNLGFNFIENKFSYECDLIDELNFALKYF